MRFKRFRLTCLMASWDSSSEHELNKDVNKKLLRFVSFFKEGKSKFYQVKYEKLPTFL